MAVQTSYSSTFAVGFPGLLADTSDSVIDSRRNEESGTLDFGLAVCQGTADDSFLLPAAAGDKAKLLGVLAHTHARDTSGGTTDGVLTGAMANVLARGRCWVKVEQDVTPSSAVYVRHTAKAGNTQKGKFRADADGVADVHTVTPTAANSTIYALRVEVGGQAFTFEYISDADGTATEIVTGFKTRMAANAEFTALVVASGTTTLILTGQNAGQAMLVQNMGDGVLSDVNTTPAAATAVQLKGARYLTTASSGGLAMLEIDANASRNQ